MAEQSATSANAPAHSPALTHQSDHYPARFTRRVPLRVKLLKTVTADPMPYPLCLDQESLALVVGQEVDVWVNSHGAVSACMPEGKNLGLKPDEFEVIAWHPVRDTSRLGTNGGW